MDGVRQYLITVTTAAIFCGIINGFVGKRNTSTAIIKLITGIFMVLAVISPWTKLDLTSFSRLTNEFTLNADSVVKSGEELAQNEMNRIIIHKTQTYILDKATSLGLDLSVAVTLNDGVPPVPHRVTITGAASPYAKSVLVDYIENNLAIPKENQLWT